MLKQRVITALLLLLLLLPALFYQKPEPFYVLTLVFIAAAGWEWARMNGLGMAASLAAGWVCILGCSGFWWAGLLSQALPRLWLIVGCAWVLLSAWALRSGVAAWASYPRPLRLVLGLSAICLTWLAMGQARLIGTNFLLSILALVWAADIGAYFSGRALGGRFTRSKLAVSISPGKSWEGVWGGMFGVAPVIINICQDVIAGFSALEIHLARGGQSSFIIQIIIERQKGLGILGGG
jgi:phosphatidate cytidylyltransferase